MGHYNQKTTLASLNRQMAFAKRKLSDCEFAKCELEKENKRLREVLEFYADEQTYKTKWSTQNDDGSASQLRATTAIREDLGAKARQVLEGK